MAWDMPYDVNEPAAPTTARVRRVGPLAWAAGALLIVGLAAGAVQSVVPHGAVSGAAPVASAAADPEPSAKPTASKGPKTAKKTAVPDPVLRYPSCNDVWAGGQGPFKEGEPCYARHLDPDGEASPASPGRSRPASRQARGSARSVPVESELAGHQRFLVVGFG